ncbi:MAG: 30S ribosome-binding factor RbfA [Acholeplasmatales bacterium]|nr:30S ribosome-binding factor RbfA [Acholeplasmatales bacterium]
MAGISLKRLESLSLRELALILQNDTKDRKLRNVTVTEVRITNDLSYMTIYYTCLFHGEREGAAQALEHSKGYLRKELAARIKARKMPELIFKYDEALEYGNHMNDLISSLNIKHDEEA